MDFLRLFGSEGLLNSDELASVQFTCRDNVSEEKREGNETQVNKHQLDMTKEIVRPV